MGKGLSNKPTSSLLFLNGCSWYDSCNTLVILCFFFFFKEGIRSYFGTPTWQTIGVFLAGVLTTVLVIRKMWKICEEEMSERRRPERQRERRERRWGILYRLDRKSHSSCFNFIVHGFNAVLDAWRAYHNVSWDWWNVSFIIKCRKWGEGRGVC